MTIGFQPNPETIQNEDKGGTSSKEKAAEKPAKKAEKRNLESVNQPRPPSLNTAFYFLNVDFLPRTARVTEPGVLDHISRELTFAYPLCVLQGSPEALRVTTPVLNDQWQTVEPIIRELEDKHELEVMRFNVETMIPQPDPTVQQQRQQMMAQQAAQAAAAGAIPGGMH
jgi:hypothetical protein